MESITLLSITLTDLRELITSAVADALIIAQPAVPNPPRDENGEQLLTRKETAELLHVSLLTLRVWERRGLLRPRRISRRVLYVRSEIMEVIQQSGLGRRLRRS